MAEIPASLVHLDEIRRLFRDSRRHFADYGAEDLPALLDRGVAILGQERGITWGFLGIQVEERPPTLPEGWPARGQLRGLALDIRRFPGASLVRLMDAAAEQFVQRAQAVQALCYGHERWLVDLLNEVGFVTVEEVVFLQLSRVAWQVATLPNIAPIARLEPAQSVHLEALALLDAETFDPIWHFGHKDLLEMLLRCRVQVALMGDCVAGYAALATNSDIEAQLARLAVHPRWQGMGLGRQLLADSLRYAASAGFETVVLNTQKTNERSQHLYRRFGFRLVGRAIPVLSRTFGLPHASSNREN